MLNVLQRYQARKEGEEREFGFTLIELLIVIVVLGVLAAVTVFALGSVTGKSAVSACNADAKTVDISIAAFKADPPTGKTPTDQLAWERALVPTYMQSFPSSSHYTISLTGDGIVQVATTNHPKPTNFDQTADRGWYGNGDDQVSLSDLSQLQSFANQDLSNFNYRQTVKNPCNNAS